MNRCLAAAASALALVASCASRPAFAEDATVPVTLPWGDWTIALVEGVVLPLLLPLIGGLAGWIALQVARLVPWLGRAVTAHLVERALTNFLDFGVNAVSDAAKGRTLSVSTGRAVLDAALRRAIAAGSPAIVRAAGGPAELAAKMFRKMDLEPRATTASVLDPVVSRLSEH